MLFGHRGPPDLMESKLLPEVLNKKRICINLYTKTISASTRSLNTKKDNTFTVNLYVVYYTCRKPFLVESISAAATTPEIDISKPQFYLLELIIALNPNGNLKKIDAITWKFEEDTWRNMV